MESKVENKENYMDTLSDSINKLQKEGYSSEITRLELKLLNPKDWKIDQIRRFEGMSNPSDSSILYAVSNKIGDRKSLVINAYGAFYDPEISEFIKKVEIGENTIYE